MEGPWFGIVIMTLLVVGLGVWIWYAMRPDKKNKAQSGGSSYIILGF